MLMLSPTEHLTIVEETPELLAVDVTYGPNGSPPPRHYHPSQSERFTVQAGRLNVKLDGKERTLAAGESLDVPARAVHQFWNAGDEPAQARWETRPPGRTAEWFRTLDAAHRSASGGDGARPPLPVMAALLTAYDDVFRLPGVPPLLLRALGTLGRKDAQPLLAASSTSRSG
jgi:quercetin dioxygenase-like cupin family protein